ncbi:hypothetical protein FGG08_002649 [Glutinoglossum americanum]|uniref:Uncharacterized protein n=1 Tax=Glutinoglossum americanum TaxID=1670608 RepID=A0A9P8L5F9_9PEZI|nr:hypothetical protein FGG08_002649 [Glutinoglossum americanum]
MRGSNESAAGLPRGMTPAKTSSPQHHLKKQLCYKGAACAFSLLTTDHFRHVTKPYSSNPRTLSESPLTPERAKKSRRTQRESFVTFHVSAPNTLHNTPELGLFDVPRRFSKRERGGIVDYLQRSAEDSPELLMILIEGFRSWLHDVLRAAMPHFPDEILAYINSYQRATLGQAVLPSFHLDGEYSSLRCIRIRMTVLTLFSDVDFAIEHYDVPEEDEQGYPPQSGPQNLGFGASEARGIPLFTWYRLRDGLYSSPDTPIVVIVGGANQSLPQRLNRLYSEQRQRRYDRLTKLPHWIYADLYFEFTRWDKVWEATREHMFALREQVYGDRPALPILEQTRALHRYMELIVDRRECLRMHIASVTRYKTGVSNLNPSGVPHVAHEDLVKRLEAILESLAHHQVTSETSVKQMENLLSLAFNTETVSQGLNVKKLNFLALIFLPLSFVAGIFGMTKFTVLPKWYPVYAIPMVVATILIVVLLGKGLSWIEKRRTMRPSLRPRGADDDEEAGIPLNGHRPSPSPGRPPSLEPKLQSGLPSIVVTSSVNPAGRESRSRTKSSGRFRSRSGTSLSPSGSARSASQSRKDRRRSGARRKGGAVLDETTVHNHHPPPPSTDPASSLLAPTATSAPQTPSTDNRRPAPPDLTSESGGRGFDISGGPQRDERSNPSRPLTPQVPGSWRHARSGGNKPVDLGPLRRAVEEAVTPARDISGSRGHRKVYKRGAPGIRKENCLAEDDAVSQVSITDLYVDELAAGEGPILEEFSASLAYTS